MKNRQSKKALYISACYLAAFFLLCGLCLNAAAQDVAVFPQLGHSGGVVAIAFSPDGRQILSGSWDRTVKLWDAATGREIRTYSGYSGGVAFSPNGKQIISGSNDGTVRLWDMSTGKEIAQFISFTDGE